MATHHRIRHESQTATDWSWQMAHDLVQCSPARRDALDAEIPTPDDVCALLNDAVVTVAGQPWQVEVYSVSDLRNARWVQLGVTGASHHLLTLRLAEDAGADDALMAVAAWLENPANAPAVLSVC